MSDLPHPPLDDLADLRAGLLPPERSEVLAGHLTTCDECSAALTSLDEVEAILADSGTTTLRMPAPVSASLDDALRRTAAERAAGVPSLSERRTAAALSKPRTSAGSRWALAAGAAVATVVLGFTAVDLLQGDGSSSSDSAATSAAAGVSADRAPGQLAPSRGAAAAPSTFTATGPTQPSPTVRDETLPRPLTAKTLAGYAQRFTRGSGSASVTPRCRRVELVPGASAADVRWHRSLAVVVVDPTARRATVYSCQAHPSPLFSTSY